MRRRARPLKAERPEMTGRTTEFGSGEQAFAVAATNQLG
jgi:hypothetical protein